MICSLDCIVVTICLYADMADLQQGPEFDSVLHRQPRHISRDIWHGSQLRLLRVRHSPGARHRDPHEKMMQYLLRSGFVGPAHMGYCEIDHSLITALVERWRPETHTFHMPTGECTITLQDIAYLTGLPIDGMPITGVATREPDLWDPLCEQLLGRTFMLQGSSVKFQHIAPIFSTATLDRLHVEHDAQSIQHATRAYILRMIGGELMPDRSGNTVHLRWLPLLADFSQCAQYSWGSAVLAYLYRHLCDATKADVRAIGGACILLQFWAWLRFPQLSPTLIPPDQRDGHQYRADRDQYRPLGFRSVSLHNDFIFINFIL